MPVKDHRWKPVLRITASLPFQSALGMVDVHVLDHILIAGGQHMSFAQRGLI